MQVVLFVFLSLVAFSSAEVAESLGNYHESVAIPLAAKIKAAEEAVLTSQGPSSRIVGGNIARPNVHPYMAGLLITYLNNSETGVCGASLISRTRLVTAAHCWSDNKLQASRFVVVLGSLFLFSGGDRIPTSRVVVYPGWQPDTLVNNLALIYLPKPVLLTPSIQPIALATNQTETFAGEVAFSAGYGVTSDNQTNVSVLAILHDVRLQVITNQQCRGVFGTTVQDNTVCTNGTEGHGTCWADGGGPLVVTRNGEPLLIGVTSFRSASGCTTGRPSGFSRISHFMSFISGHLQ